MEWIKLKEKMLAFVKKYAYVALILGVGLILMIIPSRDSQEKTEQLVPDESENTLTMEAQLSQILSQVAGAGEVRVVLSVASGQETLYQTNNDIGNEGGTSRLDTVTVTDAQRNETGLVRQINPPVYLGAVVVCKGADSPTVRLAIVEAVANATGLGADKISVLKMK